MELYGSLYNISGSVTASAFSGSFIGDGSGLVGIQASGVTGLNLSQIASGDATASITTSGFTVNKNTQIQGNLSVSGALIANEYIVSSSVTYMTTSFASGSSAFGDDLIDTHTFSGSVNIRGSISLNGSAVGTGKLDETTFQAYTSSNDGRVSALETSSGSLNSFTSSIDTTIKSKLDTENVISGSAQVNITGTTGYSTFSSSISNSIGDLSSSVATTTSGLTSTITSLSSSLTSSVGSLSSSIATTDLNQENRLTALETSSGSLNSFTSSINTTIKSKLDSESVISGSAQVNITGTTGYSTFSSSISNSINNISGAIATTTSGLTSTITNLSSSLTSSIGELSSSVATTTVNLKNRVDAIETSTGSLNSFTGSINTTIKSKLDTENVISGSIQVNITGTTGYSSFSSSVSESIGNLSSSVATTTSGLGGTISSLSSSVATTTSGLTSTITSLSSSISSSIGSLSSSVATTTSGISSTVTNLSSSVATTTSGITSTVTSLSSSVATTTSDLSSSIGSLSSSVATTTSGLTSTITSLSSSVATTTSGISTTVTNLSSSIATTTLNQSGRLDSIESKTGSYATTGSNIFKSSQTISGSVIITENLTVLGSSSITYVTSSQLRVEDNIITVNTASPGSRFGGLEVHDSGSVGIATGSLLWDSVNNRWIYQQSSEATYGGGVLLSGPRSSGSLGSELTLTSGRIAKSAGGDHLNDSNITDDGTTVTVLSNTVINGTIISTGTTIVSGSSQIAHDSTTGYVANKHIDHTSVSISAGNGLSGGGDISATRTLSLDTTSATFTSGVKTKMNTDGVISGSSQVLNGSGVWSGSAQLPSGVVSGSSQVLSGTGIWSGSAQLPSGVVSGSSQVSFGGITGVPSGLVSGSSQITFGSVSGIPSGLVSGSSQISFGSVSGVPSGLVSGSSQITLSSTTGFGSYLNQAVLTSSSPTFAGITSTAGLTVSGTGYYTFNKPLTAGYQTVALFGTTSSGLFMVSDSGIISRGAYFNNGWVATDTTGAYLNFNTSTGGVDLNVFSGGTVGNAVTHTTLFTVARNNFSFNSNAILHAGNYNSYSPSLTGTNASGTWSISISGNAATVTGGVYTSGDQTIAGIKTFSNRVVFNSSVTNRPQLPGGMLGLDTGDGNFDIWGISRDYYPSHATASSAWGLRWNGDNNDFEFVGGGTSRVILDMDGGNITNTGNISATGTISASNFSGSHSGTSSGTNTGDQTNISGNAATATFATNSSKLYSTDSTYNYSSANPYYGYLTYDGSRWLFQVSPASPAAVRVAYADTAGSAGSATTAGNITAYTINQSLGVSNSPTFSSLTLAGPLYRTSAASGYLSGGYASAETASSTGAIYTIGGSYYPTSTSLNNMYGIGYTNISGNVSMTNASGWGMYVAANGTPYVWLGAEGNASVFRGNILPHSNNSYNLGSATYGWANIYTNDLHLSNMNKPEGNEIDGTNGTWTIQEGAENLYIINNNNGKKYKIDLTEII